MVTHAIHWGEGLFLSPQHFQTAERRTGESIQLSENWNVGYPYGLRLIEIDRDALTNWRVSLSAVHIRLLDGTHLRFPEDAILDPLEIAREAFSREDQRAMVHLGLPRLRLGRGNSDVNVSVEKRWRVESIEMEDENQAGNAQHIDIRWPNVQLILGDQQIAGYDSLPLMRLRLGTTAEAPPEVDTDYIPPLLACDAWPYLHQQIITRIFDQLSGTADRLARQMIDRGVAFESGHREDLERIVKLHAINTSLGYLSQLVVLRGVHPAVAYAELSRVVGLLAIFRPERRMPLLPPYDHDDLANCFRAIQQALDISEDQRRTYVKRDFTGAGQQMQVRLEREWLGAAWSFYIGVRSKLSFSQVDQLLMRQLDMKVGSSEEVDTIYKFARAGAHLVPVADAPRDFPQNGWTYWRVDRSSEAWKAVEHTLNLGIRFNERQVEGAIDGQQTVQVRSGTDGKLIGLAFSLFAMPAPA